MVLDKVDLVTQFWKMNNLKVAVLMVTYNHEKYISQSIENIITQITNFKFKLFIGEDFSTDSTRNICISFQNKYPHLIELIQNDSNLGAQINTVNLFSKIFDSNPQYIAICDGDDYWTDPNKLQYQVDYLDANSDCSFVYNDVDVLNEYNKEIPWKIYDNFLFKVTTINVIHSHFIPTLSLVFRNFGKNNFPDWYLKIHNGDLALTLILSTFGYGHFINKKMGVYRFTGKGISMENSKNFYNFIENKLFLYYNFNIYSKRKYHSEIQNKIYNLILYYLNKSKDKKPTLNKNVILLLKYLENKKMIFSILKSLLLTNVRNLRNTF